MKGCETITSKKGDKKEEHLKVVIGRCGYPSWALKKVAENDKRKTTDKRKRTRSTESRLSYVEGVPERVDRVLKKYGVTTAMRPTQH